MKKNTLLLALSLPESFLAVSLCVVSLFLVFVSYPETIQGQATQLSNSSITDGMVSVASNAVFEYENWPIFSSTHSSTDPYEYSISKMVNLSYMNEDGEDLPCKLIDTQPSGDVDDDFSFSHVYSSSLKGWSSILDQNSIFLSDGFAGKIAKARGIPKNDLLLSTIDLFFSNTRYQFIVSGFCDGSTTYPNTAGGVLYSVLGDFAFVSLSTIASIPENGYVSYIKCGLSVKKTQSYFSDWLSLNQHNENALTYSNPVITEASEAVLSLIVARWRLPVGYCLLFLSIAMIIFSLWCIVFLMKRHVIKPWVEATSMICGGLIAIGLFRYVRLNIYGFSFSPLTIAALNAASFVLLLFLASCFISNRRTGFSFLKNKHYSTVFFEEVSI